MTVHPEFNGDSSCLNCAAFDPDPGDATPPLEGLCRRHAPRPMPYDEKEASVEYSRLLFGWPTTWSELFCGEWLPKPTCQAEREAES